MKSVDPIRDKELISEILEWLKQRNYRDYLMFLIGINTGLRISDILKLRYSDFKGTHLYITEIKTKKKKEIPINSVLRNEFKNLKPSNPKALIFKSRQGRHKAIGRKRAYQIMQDVGKEFGIENIGTHTLRKTFGYHYMQNGGDIEVLKVMFNHSDSSITARYIGINKKMVDNAYKSFGLR